MSEGRWNRQASLSAEYAMYRGPVLGFDAQAFFPEGEEPEIYVGLRLLGTF